MLSDEELDTLLREALKHLREESDALKACVKPGDTLTTFGNLDIGRDSILVILFLPDPKDGLALWTAEALSRSYMGDEKVLVRLQDGTHTEMPFSKPCIQVDRVRHKKEMAEALQQFREKAKERGINI